jgi:hypothetical protein
LPQALLYPQLVASVGSLPLTELLGHLPPGGSRPRHPQDAAQDGAVLALSGLPVPPLCGGRRGQTSDHSSSVRCASSSAIAALLGGPSPPTACLAARFAARQRAATAWCARLHKDHPKSKRLRRSGSATASSTSRLTSGTVGWIRRPAWRSPFYGFLPLRRRRSA